MNTLKTLMSKKTSSDKTSLPNGVSLGRFPSPVNGDLIEVIALFRGNKKIGDSFIQLSVLPVGGDIADKTSGRYAICGNCPHHMIGSCYAYDQGLFSMMKAFRNNKYETMELSEFFIHAQGKDIRFGRFGDLSLLPFEFVNEISKNCKGFTGYTNQWRSSFYDPRFNDLFMLSTIGNKDSLKALKKFPNARQFKVISPNSEYVNDADKNVITCPSESGFKCSECKLCDGGSSKVASVNIEIKAHGLDFKSKRINKLLRNDLISIEMV